MTVIQAPPTTRGAKVVATKHHPLCWREYYCGIDLHARRMYIWVLDGQGKILVHRNGPATRDHFLATIAAYRENVVVAVECIFTW